MKAKAVFKFNSGRGALLCSQCCVILKVGSEFTDAEWSSLRGEMDLEPQFCDDCKLFNIRNALIRKENEMDIGSGKGYPSSALSNFSPHGFTIDGVECASMEGFLQALKHKDPEMQKHVCTLVGIKAKNKGRKKKWWQHQILYWQGKEIKRDSQEYQDLLDKAYNELGKNTGFQKALRASGKAVFKHSIGKRKKNETVLTIQEFCSRLTKLRDKL